MKGKKKMFESLKKIAFKKVLFSSIVMIIIGVALIIWMGKEALGAITGYTDFYDLAYDEYSNQLVEIDLQINLGSFIKETETTTRRNGSSSTKTTHYYYATFTGDGEYLVALRVPAKYSSEMKKVEDYTWDEGPAASITLYGEVKKIGSEDRGYFQKWIKSFVGEDAVFEDWAIPYYINIVDKTATDVMGCLLTVIGFVLIIIAIIRICGAASGSTLKKLRSDLAAAGLTEATAESDYNSAVTFSKGAQLSIGRQCIYYMSGSTPRAIPTTQLTWSYQTTTTHRRNGIKTGTTYSILFYINGEKNAVTYPVPNEATVQEALRQISARFPWVVVGYTDDLKRMYNRDRDQFMNLRFNTVEHIPVEPGFDNVNNV